MSYYNQELDEIYKRLSTDPNKGLSDGEARARIERDGLNEIPDTSTWLDQLKVIIAPLMNWLILIYLIGAIILYIASRIQGESNLSMIYTTLAIVAINCIVAVFQQIRATKKLNALRELSAPVCVVIRDGEKKEIPAKELAVGDLIQLNLGDKIPADARIIDSTNFEVNESSLTGESEPVKKNRGKALSSDEVSIGERKNMVFLGTYITRGNGKAIVVATGPDTELGKIQKGLQESSSAEIPIRQKMNNFGKWLGIIVMGFWLVTLFIMWVSTGEGNVFKSLNSAMDIMPINIPLLTTIILITGVLFMAKTGVIIRNLASVDSLGRVSIVCTDKTGTLTKSQMTVKNVWVNNQTFDVEGTGYDPQGYIKISNEKTISDKNVGFGIEDFEQYPYLKLLLISGFFNNNAKITVKDKDIGDRIIKTWDAMGNPTEASLMTLYEKTLKEKPQNYKILHEFPFSSDLKRMSKVVEYQDNIYIHSKGATSVLLERCDKIIQDDKIQEMTDSHKEEVMKRMEQFASKGYRVLSLGYKEISEKPNPDDYEDNRDSFEDDLTYIGFVTILDPPRDNVDEAVKTCHSAGIEVVMITGDAAATARAIAKQIGIIRNDQQLAIRGSEIEEYIDKPEFDDIRVFARVSPENKQTIVKKYQSENKVVAMTGDGVNDALALNLADAGVAMGIQGTDVAKEASDMVISDDSFNSIVKGIHQGRGIFTKIRSIVFFYIAINVFEGIIQFFLAVILNLPYFLSPAFYWQWVWLSITVHMFPGLILTFDTISDDVMDDKPRDSEEILSTNIVKLLLAFGVLMSICMIFVYFLGINGIYGVFEGNIYDSADFLYSDAYTLEDYFPTEETMQDFVEMCESIGRPPTLETLRLFGKTLTMLMTVLFFSESFLVLQIRRPNKSLLRSIKEDSNVMMYIIIGLLFASFLAILYIPKAQTYLGSMGQEGGFNFMFMPLTALDWFICFLISLISIFGFEGIKYSARKRGIVF